MERNVACKFRLAKNLNVDTPAFLVNFTNGPLTDGTDMKFMCCRHSEDKNAVNSSARRILLASNDRLNYKSSVSRGRRGVNISPHRYYIGVRNKSSGRMKIYDSMSFSMDPVLKTMKEPEQTVDTRDFREQLDDLTMSFGSKGKIRAATSRLKYNKSSPSALVDDVEVMQNDASEIGPKRSYMTRDTTAASEYIPPQNFNAQTAEEVYNIQDIISLEEDEQLNYEAEALKAEYPNRISQWRKDNTYCKYVLSHLEKGVSDEKLKYLIYYNYLVLFSKLQYKDMRRKDPAPEIPDQYKIKMLDYFTISSSTQNGKFSRTFPEKMKDKVLVYLLVLALFIDDFYVNIPSVRDDLKVSLKKLTDIAQIVGCHVISRKVQDSLLKFAELKLPLFVLPGHALKWKR